MPAAHAVFNGRMGELEALIGCLRDCARLLPQPALERCLPACVAAVRGLLRQCQAGAARAICLLAAAIDLLALVAVKLLRVSHSGSSTHNGQQQQRRQQPAEVSMSTAVLALEAAAVCASALCAAAAAAADALPTGSQGSRDCDSRDCDSRPARFISLAARTVANVFSELGDALTPSRSLYEALPLQHLLVALAATEAGVRLAGRLVQLRGQLAALSGAEAAGTAAGVCEAVQKCIPGVMFITTHCQQVLMRTRGDPARDDAAIATAAGHLGASAAKLGRAVACQGPSRELLLGTFFVLQSTSDLLLASCCRWQSGQPSIPSEDWAVLGSRCVGAVGSGRRCGRPGDCCRRGQFFLSDYNSAWETHTSGWLHPLRSDQLLALLLALLPACYCPPPTLQLPPQASPAGTWRAHCSRSTPAWHRWP